MRGLFGGGYGADEGGPGGGGEDECGAVRVLAVTDRDDAGESVRHLHAVKEAVLPPGDRESGRGLFLVECLATRWGWEPRNPIGKTVWAEVAAPGRPSGPRGDGGDGGEGGEGGEGAAGR